MSEGANKGVLGILGGTFDPVHLGHLKLAEDAMAKLGLARVLWIPAGIPPHRTRPVASAQQRLAMVALAIRGHDRFALDDSEVRADAPSYTVTTLRRLRAQHGEQQPLVILLGADAFLGLAGWWQWRELFSLAHIAIATRPGFALRNEAMDDELREEYLRRRSDDYSCLTLYPAGNIAAFAITPLDISASAARTLLAQGQSVADLLPAAVLDYISTNHPYSAS